MSVTQKWWMSHRNECDIEIVSVIQTLVSHRNDECHTEMMSVTQKWWVSHRTECDIEMMIVTQKWVSHGNDECHTEMMMITQKWVIPQRVHDGTRWSFMSVCAATRCNTLQHSATHSVSHVRYKIVFHVFWYLFEWKNCRRGFAAYTRTRGMARKIAGKG